MTNPPAISAMMLSATSIMNLELAGAMPTLDQPQDATNAECLPRESLVVYYLDVEA